MKTPAMPIGTAIATASSGDNPVAKASGMAIRPASASSAGRLDPAATSPM